MKLNKIRYFHPTGKTELPNGHHIHLGGFCKECRDNENCFHYNFKIIIVFPVESKKIILKDGTTYFSGEFIDKKHKSIFNKNSHSIGYKNCSRSKFLRIIENIFKNNNIDSLLSKYKNTIYIINK